MGDAGSVLDVDQKSKIARFLDSLRNLLMNGWCSSALEDFSESEDGSASGSVFTLPARSGAGSDASSSSSTLTTGPSPLRRAHVEMRSRMTGRSVDSMRSVWRWSPGA